MIERTKHIGIIFLVLTGVFALGVSFGAFIFNSEPAQLQLGSPEIITDLTIDYGNGDVQSFLNEVLMQGNSALDQLQAVERRYGIVIEARNFPGIGVFVEGIHGVRNTNTSYWQFWVNDEYAKVGAGQYILEDGDRVLWKRTNE